MSDADRVPPVPAVLRLVQMVVLGRWRATGEDLYRELVHLLEPSPGKEILVSGCGDGVTAEWLARVQSAHPSHRARMCVRQATPSSSGA